MPVYLLDIDVPENVAWDPPAYARLSPERYGLQTGRPVFARHRPGSKPSTTEETIIALLAGLVSMILLLQKG